MPFLEVHGLGISRGIIRVTIAIKGLITLLLISH